MWIIDQPALDPDICNHYLCTCTIIIAGYNKNTTIFYPYFGFVIFVSVFCQSRDNVWILLILNFVLYPAMMMVGNDYIISKCWPVDDLHIVSLIFIALINPFPP